MPKKRKMEVTLLLKLLMTISTKSKQENHQFKSLKLNKKIRFWSVLLVKQANILVFIWKILKSNSKIHFYEKKTQSQLKYFIIIFIFLWIIKIPFNILNIFL